MSYGYIGPPREFNGTMPDGGDSRKSSNLLNRVLFKCRNRKEFYISPSRTCVRAESRYKVRLI